MIVGVVAGVVFRTPVGPMHCVPTGAERGRRPVCRWLSGCQTWSRVVRRGFFVVRIGSKPAAGAGLRRPTRRGGGVEWVCSGRNDVIWAVAGCLLAHCTCPRGAVALREMGLVRLRVQLWRGVRAV